MFKSLSKQQPEMNPIDLLRKYAPYLVGAGGAVGTITALYYQAFDKSGGMVDKGFNESGKTMGDMGDSAEDTTFQSMEDAGVENGSKSDYMN